MATTPQFTYPGLSPWQHPLSYTANYYSHSTAFVQSKDCNANLITAIDSALSLTVIHYSQTTANVQLMTALIAKSDNN